MRLITTTILLTVLISNVSNAQTFKYFQGKGAPRFVKSGNTQDSLLYPFAGGLNTPQFSNCDWNNDGKADLFVFDKEAMRPLTFVYDVSTGKMLHAPEYEAAFGNYFSGWALLRDHNFDGKPDLFTASFTHNKVTSEPFVFSEKIQLFNQVASPEGKPQFKQYNNVLFDTGMFIGPPYNQALQASQMVAVSNAVLGIDDMDGDGDDDILTNQGVNTTFAYYENYKKNKHNYPFSNDTAVYIMRDQCWGFVNYDFYKHAFILGFKRSSGSQCDYNMWEKRAVKHADQSTLLIDINGDGIKDVLFSDSEFKSFVLLINGRLQNKLGIDSIIAQDTLLFSTNGQRRNFMEYPVAYYVDTDGDSKKELVISTNKSFSSRSRNNIWRFDATRVNSILQFFERSGNGWLYDEMLDHGLRSVPSFTDADKDGDLDLVVATSGVMEYTNNNNDMLYLYENIGTSNNPVFKLIDTNYADISRAGGGQGFFSAHPTFGDLNGDGADDILVGEGNGNIAYFRKSGNGFVLENRNAFGLVVGTYATPQLIDLDKDGILDIVCGQRNGWLQFFRNTGTKTNPVFNTTPTIDSLGRINSKEIYKSIGIVDQPELQGFSAPCVVDLNKDGVFEVLVGSNSGKVWLYTGVYAHKDSVAKLVDAPYADNGKDGNAGYYKRFGTRSTVAVASLNGDTLPDLVIGNISGGLVFMGSDASIYSGIQEKSNKTNEVLLYPNPAQESVTIQLTKPAGNVNYSLYDLTGKKIMEGEFEKNQTSTSIMLSNLRDGIYMVQLIGDGWHQSKKLIVNR